MTKNIKKNIDWKDRKILKELDLNARQPLSKIAKKTQLSKQVVLYRLNNLIKNKIIKDFITYIDVGVLGYTFYDIFFKLKYISKDKEQIILQKIKKMPEVGWFVSSRGEWKLVVCVMARNTIEFHSVLEKIIEILGNKIIDYNFFIVINAMQLPYKEVNLIENEYFHKLTHLGSEKGKLSKTELGILKELANNARIPRREIAKNMKISEEKVRYAIKKLEKTKVIQAYKPLINVFKLDLFWHLALIQFNYCSDKVKKDFINFLKNQKEVFYIVEGVGNWSLMVEFHTLSIDDFEKSKEKINLKFQDIIRDQRIMMIIEEHKCTFFPGQITV